MNKTTKSANARKRTVENTDAQKHIIQLELIMNQLTLITERFNKEDREKKALLENISRLQERNSSNLKKTSSSYTEMAEAINHFKTIITCLEKSIPQFVDKIEANNIKFQKAISIKIGWIMWFLAYVVVILFSIIIKMLIA